MNHDYTGEQGTIEESFGRRPTFDELETELIEEFRPEEAYARLGAHMCEHRGIAGTRFAVWAPGARAVSVVGNFNRWDGRLHRMRPLGPSGVWELFVAGVAAGARYKYEILTADGELTLKADPYAQRIEPPPTTASVVFESRHVWSAADLEWLRGRGKRTPLDEPMSIYELHLGSWRRNAREDNRPLSYLELADELSAYVSDMGFTHVELLPVMAHPFIGSWGYQVTSYFAPTPEHGSPDELRQLVDRLHAAGIGVILDWVPAHFSRDEFALARFDGTPLFEHADPARGAHPDWGTLVFDYGRSEVRRFLIASALFWLREYHVDGLRVDAVASMLYLDYSRREGEWLPNRFGGREDLDAVAFLKDLNDAVSSREPGAFCAAEDTSTWPGVSRPPAQGGLGFGFKWNTGWMHDTLRYFGSDLAERPGRHHEITFSMMYAYSERFVLPLCHDDVADGRGSLLSKMAGDRREALANLRALYAYMWAHPGKKLLFMGGELAQEAEWSHERSLDWHLLEHPDHAGMRALVRDLNRIYRDEPALWELDADVAGFYWLDPDDADRSVIAFVRASRGDQRVLLFAANLSPVLRASYRLGLPRSCRWQAALDTDSPRYGGSGTTALGGSGTTALGGRATAELGDLGTENLGYLQPEPVPWHGQPVSAEVTLPPLSAIWLVPESA